MAWTAPVTFVSGAVLTAAQLNTHLRDNLLETAVAKATTAGSFFVGAGTNSIVERTPAINSVLGSDTTNSTSFGNLDATTGPSVTVSVGDAALVAMSAAAQNNTVNGDAMMGVELSGDTTASASTSACLIHRSSTANAREQCSYVVLYSGMTAGTNTLTAKYQVNTGTATFSGRRLSVVPF